MTPEEETFFNECPAWARKLGVADLKLWNFIESIMPYDWPDRFDFLQSGEVRISSEEDTICRRVLEAWDAMSENHADKILNYRDSD